MAEEQFSCDTAQGYKIFFPNRTLVHGEQETFPFPLGLSIKDNLIMFGSHHEKWSQSISWSVASSAMSKCQHQRRRRPFVSQLDATYFDTIKGVKSPVVCFEILNITLLLTNTISIITFFDDKMMKFLQRRKKKNPATECVLTCPFDSTGEETFPGLAVHRSRLELNKNFIICILFSPPPLGLFLCTLTQRACS